MLDYLPLVITRDTAPRFADQQSDQMEFNVIVTFVSKKHVLEKLDFNTQVVFDIVVDVYACDTYDDVMKRLKSLVLAVMKIDFEFNEADFLKISTCGTWHVWEKLTGLDVTVFLDNSTFARNGKIFF
jgi:hypothetical protein